MTAFHKLVDFDDLERLADFHLPEGWRRVGDVEVSCGVSRRGVRWTVTVHAVSSGGASRYLCFKANEMQDAIDLATTIMNGRWRGWEIFE